MSLKHGGMRGILLASAGPGIIHNAAYANSLTPFIPDLYGALDTVSRELVGLIPSVRRNTGVEAAAVGEELKWPVSRPKVAKAITPAMTAPTPDDVTLDNRSIKITHAEAVEFGINGEEQRGLSHSIGADTFVSGEFAEALRTLTNKIEAQGCVAAYVAASRAVGTAGTTPFGGTDLEDAALVRQILDDNGAPSIDRSLIVNTSAGVKLRKHAQMSNVDQSGTAMGVRQGQLLDIFGFSTKESAGIVKHTAGTAASATTGTAGYAVGATTIALASAGTGAIKAGDVISFAGQSNKYVVVTGDADVSGGGNITIAAPGLLQAIPAAATAITVQGSYTANLGFTRSAIGLGIRPPAVPTEGDAAIDRFLLTDPRSGMTFEVAIYPGYRMVRYEVAAAWGWAALKPEHIALLLG